MRWIVVGQTGGREKVEATLVEATKCSIEHGALAFYKFDGLVHAYAPGQWLMVSEAGYESD